MIASVSFACMTDWTKSATAAEIKKFKTSHRHPAAVTAFAEKSKTPALESQLGNLLLNEKQAILSLPVKMLTGPYHPFGDGQSNAKMSLGALWKPPGFPVIGAEITAPDGKKQRRYVFHESLKISNYKESDLGDGWQQVQPAGWDNSFYFSFNTSTLSTADFLKGIPPQHRTFSNSRIAPDPASVGKENPLSRLMGSSPGEGYNSKAWYSDNVHGLFPDAGGTPTALGGVLTWGIVDKKFGPFKQLYTCFEARSPAKENTSGFPTGAGWHLIGDPAETLFNNLSAAALPVAIARSRSGEKAAYGLTDVITATWLAPDQVFVTKKDEFHWYLNPYESEVCTEIWVQNCVPGLQNNWGFNCN